MVILTHKKYEKCLKWVLSHFEEKSVKYTKTILALEKYEAKHFPLVPRVDEEK